MDEAESEDTVAERILPMHSSYAGVLLGLRLQAISAHDPTPISIFPTQDSSLPPNPSLTIISSPIILAVTQRSSRRLAAKAEQEGGRLVYSHTTAPRVILR